MRRPASPQKSAKTPDPQLAFITSAIRKADKMLHCYHPFQVRQVRQSVGGSQREFAARFGLSPRTLASWESGRRGPDRAATALLKVIAYAPDVVDAALKAEPDLVGRAAEQAQQAEHSERDERD
ncbi:MAG: helix-turn-helix domain-containing protein [Rhodospirillaceae bacterium]